MIILVLLLSIAALTLGIMLFLKREILKGRTQKLETTLVKLGKLIEETPPVPEDVTPSDYPKRDVSPCMAEDLPDPERSAFWNSYKPHLELTADAEKRMMLDTEERQRLLMTYFWVDPISGQKKLDGENTMEHILELAINKTEAQMNLLDETREQLQIIRAELEATITNLNEIKQVLRAKLLKIVELENEIVRLNGVIEEKDARIAELEGIIVEKDAVIKEREDEIEIQKDEVAIRDSQITSLKRENARLTKLLGIKGEENWGQNIRIKPGHKGTVSIVNTEWNFVVIKTDPLGEDDGEELEEDVNLIIHRSNKPDEFVAKVKVSEVRRGENMTIAEIAPEWQKRPIKVGDSVVY